MLDTKIAELRKEKGISQEQLAEVLSTTRQAVSKWERGESYPDIDRLKELAVYFNVSIDYLLNYDVESVSVNRFRDRLSENVKAKRCEIGFEEIKLVVSANANNVLLLSDVISYLIVYWTNHHDDAVADAIIDYSKRLLALYRPDKYGAETINEIQKTIAIGYMLKKDYASVRSHILENHVYGAEDYLMQSEIELGNYEGASDRASESFLNSVSHIIDAQFIQLRTLLKSGNIQEAYELSGWGLSFLASLQKKEKSLLLPIFAYTYVKSICERHLGLDQKGTIAFLKENANEACKRTNETDGFRFYYGSDPAIFIVVVGDLRNYLRESCVDSLKDSPAYESALAIHNEVFGG